MKGAKDKEIAEYAQRGTLTILTLDANFAQIYHVLLRRKLTVIVIKANPATPANIINILNIAQQKINLAQLQNKLIIITKNRIRIIN